MPTVSRITTLNQANATLSHCWSKLWTAGLQTVDKGVQTQDQRQLRSWLERWEVAFKEFLSNALASMGTEELTHCRILKANHLACTILASQAEPSATATNSGSFEAEFRAIVELAGAVLHTREQTSPPQSASTASTTSPVDFSPSTCVLDVHAPLYIVMARCSNVGLLDRANRISLQSRGI